MDLTARIAQARLIARELWTLMREDASHRLGIAEAFPQANDKLWTPEFYRRCQLAERLAAILDELAARGTSIGDAGDAEAGGAKDNPHSEDLERTVPRVPPVSRRRLGV